MSHDSLDAVIAAYMLAVECGEVPNRQELLDQHSEHAEALRAFFTDLDHMDRVASPLRLAGGVEATRTAGANGHVAPPTVRYFGDYELLEEVARGGMGIVYKSRQASLNRVVALKMILAGGFASSLDVRRFRTEAEAAANLAHPHIVPIYEVGEHEGQQYYSMRYVEGTSLAKRPRGDERSEVDGLISVARAVHHAHQHGVLHRDLKPSNVLVDPCGSWFVTDFGLAKRLESADRSLTEPGQILGTPRYMAPEQAGGRKDLTVAADVYSLGVILYERLTGRTPFTGDDVLAVLRQVRDSEPPRPSTFRPGMDRDLETVVLKCLVKEPTHRYPSAEALADDLSRWLAGKPITARPIGSFARAWKWARRNPAVAALATSVGGLLAALLVGSILASVRSAAAARSSQGLYLAAQSELVRASNPGLALVLALEGAERHPGPISNNAMLAALENCDELRTLVGHREKITALDVAPNGRIAATGSEDRTARVWNLVSGQVVATLDHDAPVLAVRFTPDGQRLVTFSGASAIGDEKPAHAAPPTIRVWDAATGRKLVEVAEAEVAEAPWKPNPDFGIDVSRDGRWLVVTSARHIGHPPRIIDLRNGSIRAQLIGHEARVGGVAFSPDGRRVATASADGTARLWDAETGRELKRLIDHTSDVWLVAFSPDGRRLLTLGSGWIWDIQKQRMIEGWIPDKPQVLALIWDVETGAESVRLTWPDAQYGFAGVARFHPDGRTIVTAGRGAFVYGGQESWHPAIWDGDRGTMVASLRRMDPHPDWKDPASTALAISPDGERLAIGYDDGLVRLLSRSGALLKSLRGHGRSVVRALAFTPDSRRLLSACDDGTTRVWDSRIGEEAEVAHGRWANLFFPIFSNDGQTLVANVSGPHYPNGEAITFRDPSDGRALRTFDIRATIGFVSGDVVLALSPDGSTLAVAHIHDGCAQLLDAKTGRTKLRLMASKGHVIASIRFSPDGTKVVTYSSSPGASYWMDEDISACIWDARDGRRLAVLKDSEPEVTRAVLGVAFTPDGQRLATASGDHTARIWNVDAGREQLVLRGHQAELYAVSFTDDGRRVATVSGDGTARIWDASTGRELSRMALEGHEGRIVGAALSPGGTHIVTFGEDQTARLWDGLTGRLLGTLIKHVKGIRSAVFSPNGQIVAVTLGGDPVMTHAWPVDFLSAARARSPRELTLAERARFELPAP